MKKTIQKIRYTTPGFAQLPPAESLEGRNEHLRIERMRREHEKNSIKVAWGFVIFWAILGMLVLLWLYTYVYVPVSGLWN